VPAFNFIFWDDPDDPGSYNEFYLDPNGSGATTWNVISDETPADISANFPDQCVDGSDNLVDCPVLADGGSINVPFSDVEAGGQNVYEGSITLTYTDEASAPEPRNWILIALGLSGLGYRLRRKATDQPRSA
jgi:hypothetical protein